MNWIITLACLDFVIVVSPLQSKVSVYNRSEDYTVSASGFILLLHKCVLNSGHLFTEVCILISCTQYQNQHY